MINDFGSAVFITGGEKVLHGGDWHRCHPDSLSACSTGVRYTPRTAHDLFSLGAMAFEMTHVALFSTVRQQQTPGAIVAQWRILISRVPFLSQLLGFADAVDYAGVLSLVEHLVLSDIDIRFQPTVVSAPGTLSFGCFLS
jgi:hypothetical protein